ncbi:NlpC/P60 family protein [Blastococcus sp. Marseille-P5729]|uniref:C40 family peptidase n=1 Tax=Blastococcus sp. Marseille-P5729 TaxID=2086582 RepID=UPI001F3D66E8|nr:NlpC/P60 family protein [Blastococcus sp. Marseille-P5729]
MAVNTTRGRRSLGVAGIATSCILGLVLSPTTAHADPAADKASVQAQIVQAQHDIATIAEQYNDAKIELEELNAAKDEAHAAATQAGASLVDEQQKVADAGANLYKGPAMVDVTTFLSAGGPQDAIDKLSTLSVISEHYGQSIQALTDGQAQAAAAEAEAAKAAEAAAATEQQLSAKKAEIEAKLPVLEQQLASLTEAERQAVLDQAGGHADEGAAEDVSESSSTSSSSNSSASSSSSSSSSSSAPAPSAPQQVSAGSGGSSTAQGAVQAALSKLGSPYVWAAAGPNSFDCSGLTMWAYAQVGVSLPHSSSAQSSAGSTVSLSALAPGDIVWMPGHVGMYIGNGQVVHAPTTGDVVKVVSLGSMKWQKGVRIV